MFTNHLVSWNVAMACMAPAEAFVNLGLLHTSKPKRFVLLVKIPYNFHKGFNHQHQLYGSRSCCSSYSNLCVGRNPTALANALSLSENSKSSVLGTQFHGHIIKLGLYNDIFLQNNLIKMYTKCGDLSNGRKVFVEMPERNLVSWTLIISGAIHNGELESGLEIYSDMTRTGLMPNEFALGSVMKLCANMGANEFGLCVHCFALKIGMEKNPFVGSSILNFYAKLGNIEAAEQVFQCTDNVDVGCWNAMIGGYAQCGYSFEAMNLVSLMCYEGLAADKYTFINVLKGCLVMGDLNFGRYIHGSIIRSELEICTSVLNALMDMYFKYDEKESALKVFRRISNKDVVSWNILLGGFSQNEDPKEVAISFHDFMLTGIRPNHVTFLILFRQCGELLDLELGLQFYCLALHFGFFDEANVTSSLINMLSRCGAMEMARSAFDNVCSNNIITWNELISGYNLNCRDTEALQIFCNLWELGVQANECTFSVILDVCCRFENQQLSRLIHGAIVKSGFASHGYVCSSLIKAYAKFGLLDDSFEFFNGPERLEMTSWGTMVSALVHQGCNYEAIRFLNSLIEAGEKPDEYILGSILNSCAGIAAYHQTKSVHSFIIKLGFDTQVFVASAIIDAYAKCGDVESARIAFDQSFTSNDMITYNTMIMAYGHHGLIKEAMEIFEKMKLANLQPSQATFVSVISACSHMGLVDQGRILFESMELEYGIEPSPDIYGCIVDMLSRNGCLEDAKYIIEVMPFPPWPAVLRSLLSGCRIHGDRKLGEWAAKKLLQLVPGNDAAYVLWSKVYSEGGSWEDAAKVRRGMIARSIPKDVGYSWIEIW